MESLNRSALLRDAKVAMVQSARAKSDEDKALVLGRFLRDMSGKVKPEAATFILTALHKADQAQDPAKRLLFLRNFTQLLRVEIAYRSIDRLEWDTGSFCLVMSALFALLPIASEMRSSINFRQAYHLTPKPYILYSGFIGLSLSLGFVILVQKEQFKQELFKLSEEMGSTNTLQLLSSEIRPYAEAEIRSRASANRPYLNQKRELLPLYLGLNLPIMIGESPFSPQEIRDAYPRMESARSISIDQLREILGGRELFGSGEISIDVAKTAAELSKKLGSNGLRAAAVAARANEFAGARSCLSDQSRSNEVIRAAIALLYQ